MSNFQPPPPPPRQLLSTDYTTTPNTTTNDTHTSAYRSGPQQQPNGRPPSPKAPAFSPITPKAQPVLPVNVQPPPFVPPENGGNFTFSPTDIRPSGQQQAQSQKQQPEVKAPAAQYIPQPPNLPFSSEDATDAIALRAAISTLQFQKQKAQDDIRTLRDIKKLALDDPHHFKEELVAGRLKERRLTMADLRSIIDNPEEGDSDDEVVLGASREDDNESSRSSAPPAEIPDSQPSRPSSSSEKQPATIPTAAKHHFPRIPEPQNIVRMPPINWDKYGIVGEPLDHLHNVQQQWPGAAPGYGMDRGREYTIAAPYSPFLDKLDAQPRYDGSGEGPRKDSGPSPSATGTISEHPMSTRSRH